RQTWEQAIEQRFQSLARATGARQIARARKDELLLLVAQRVVPGGAEPASDEVDPRTLRSGRVYLTRKRSDAGVESLCSRFEHTHERAQEVAWLSFRAPIDRRQVLHEGVPRIQHGELVERGQ